MLRPFFFCPAPGSPAPPYPCARPGGLTVRPRPRGRRKNRPRPSITTSRPALGPVAACPQQQERKNPVSVSPPFTPYAPMLRRRPPRALPGPRLTRARRPVQNPAAAARLHPVSKIFLWHMRKDRPALGITYRKPAKIDAEASETHESVVGFFGAPRFFRKPRKNPPNPQKFS